MYRIMKFEVLKKETPYLWTYSPFLIYISEITVAKLRIAEQLLSFKCNSSDSGNS